MSTDEFQQIWKAYDTKINRSFELNKKLLEEIGSAKVRRSFNRLVAVKFFAVFCGILWIAACATLAWKGRTEPIFLVAVIGIMIFGIIAVCGYTVQLLLIGKINYYENILDTQKDLAKLEWVMIRTYRILVLQAPFYTFFFISKQMAASMSIGYWIFQVCFTGLFVWLSVWLYRHITLQNMDKRWMKSLMKGEGWKSIMRARGFIREIEEFKKEG